MAGVILIFMGEETEAHSVTVLPTDTQHETKLGVSASNSSSFSGIINSSYGGILFWSVLILLCACILYIF